MNSEGPTANDQEPVEKYDNAGASGSSSFEPAAPETGNGPVENQAAEDIPDLPIYHYVGLNKPMPAVFGDQRDYQLDWLGEKDPGHPLNWPMRKKLRSFVISASACLTCVFGSAIIGPGLGQVKEKWHLGLPVVTLTVSLYVVGFAVGPVIWGPMSEATGRWLPLVIGLLGQTIFAFACASAANFQTLVLCRFFAGTFGASTLSVGPAVLSDIFATFQRGKAIGAISVMIFAGPMLAPVVGGYISASFLGWRWTQYIWGIASALALLALLLLEETYPPKILAHRARDVRVTTGNWAITAPLEDLELDFKEIATKTILKPIRMLFIEPILFLISLYHGFIYGILYLCLEAVPIIFGNYGWHGGNTYLPYLGMLIGCFIMSAIDLVYFEPLFNKRLIASGKSVLPEERLPLMMVSGVVFPIGIFLLCWSGAYRVQWFVPTLGCTFIGAGLVGIFMAAFNYIIDTYLVLAASAISANTFLRSAFGAAFPLFAHPMFINLDTQWAGTLLGCLAVLLTPVPFLFYKYGEKVRTLSKYALNVDALDKELTRRSTSTRRTM